MLTRNIDIQHAFHALALDEHRAPFSPTLWHFPADGDLATKKPKRPHDEIYRTWKRIRSDPQSTLQQISDAWAELIDAEMYDGLKGTDSELVQVWFPGFHINIGGGSDDALKDRKGDFERKYLELRRPFCTTLTHSEIALITFAWMCEQIAPYLQLDINLLNLARNSLQDRYDLIDAPLQVPPTRLPKSISDLLSKAASDFLQKTTAREGMPTQDTSQDIRYGWATGPIVDSFAGSVALAGSTIRTPGRYTEDKSNGVRLGRTNEMIHPTVKYRMDKRVGYKPEALDGFVHQQIRPDLYEWKHGDTTIPEFVIKSGDAFSRYLEHENERFGASE